MVKNNKITDACSLTNILAIAKAHSDNISKSLFEIDITSFIDSVAEAIEEDSTMDEVTKGKMLVLIEQFMTLATCCHPANADTHLVFWSTLSYAIAHAFRIVNNC